MVEDSAPVHLSERCFRHGKRLRPVFSDTVLHQKHQIVGRRKLRRASEPAVLFIEAAGKLAVCLPYNFRPRLGRYRKLLLFFEKCLNLVRAVQKFLPLFFPLLRRSSQQPVKPYPAIARPGRKIRPREKRPAVRCHNNGQRPSSLPVHGLADRHIHRINIRSLLPVYLDTDILPVQKLCYFPVFK